MENILKNQTVLIEDHHWKNVFACIQVNEQQSKLLANFGSYSESSETNLDIDDFVENVSKKLADDIFKHITRDTPDSTLNRSNTSNSSRLKVSLNAQNIHIHKAKPSKTQKEATLVRNKLSKKSTNARTKLSNLLTLNEPAM